MKPERIQSDILDLLGWKDAVDTTAHVRVRRMLEDGSCSSLMVGVAQPWTGETGPANGSGAVVHAPASDGGPDPFQVAFEGVGLLYEHQVLTTLLWALMRDREALWGSQVGGMLTIG